MQMQKMLQCVFAMTAGHRIRLRVSIAVLQLWSRTRILPVPLCSFLALYGYAFANGIAFARAELAQG